MPWIVPSKNSPMDRVVAIKRTAIIILGIVTIAFSVWHGIHAAGEIRAICKLVLAEWAFDLFCFIVGIFAIRRGIKRRAPRTRKGRTGSLTWNKLGPSSP